MTILGKILTVFLFLFSLVFLGFAVTINQLNKDPQTAKSWYSLVQEFKQKEKDYQADLKGKAEELAALRAQIGTLTKRIDTVTKDGQTEIAQKEQQIQRVNAENAAVKNKFAGVQADLIAATAELERRRNEAVKLHDTIKQKDTDIAALQVEKTEAINKATQQTVLASSLQNRNVQLEKDLTVVTQENEELRDRLNNRATVGGPGGKPAVVIDQPPPGDIEGVIKEVGQGNLVSISIGSDAGLLKGHTLQVFRLNPKSEYLGKVQIIEVSPHEAVGKMLDSRLAKQVQVGDKVASRIVK